MTGRALTDEEKVFILKKMKDIIEKEPEKIDIVTTTDAADPNVVEIRIKTKVSKQLLNLWR